jgi:hypothetical protein
MNINQSVKSLSVLLFALFFVAAAQAQSDPAPSKKGKSSGTEMKSNKKADSMEDELKLSPEQKAQFKKADDNFKAKSKAARSAKKEDMEQLREERKRAHKAALNADQAAKYDEIMARKEAKKAQKNQKKPSKGNKVKKEKSGNR